MSRGSADLPAEGAQRLQAFSLERSGSCHFVSLRIVTNHCMTHRMQLVCICTLKVRVRSALIIQILEAVWQQLPFCAMRQKVGDARHIIVVDGNRGVRASLVEYLRKNGFSAAGVAHWHAIVHERRADLIIFDLTGPGAAGLTECARIRDEWCIPVIAIAAQADDIDRILALEVGADDFVAKPFNPREVLARVRNVLRRADVMSAAVSSVSRGRYCFAGWTLDTTSRSLIDAAGESVPLAGGEFELLYALVTNANRVLSRDELLGLTKGRGGQPFDRSIDVKISRLRQRLGDSQESRIIKAIYGKGYVLATPVAVEG